MGRTKPARDRLGQFAPDAKAAADISAVDIDDPWGPPIDPSDAASQPARETTLSRHTMAEDSIGIDMALMLEREMRQPAPARRLVEDAPRGFTRGLTDEIAPFTGSTHVPLYYGQRFLGAPGERDRNGSNGLIKFAGIGAPEARSLLAKLSPDSLDETHAEGTPSTRAILEAVAGSDGSMEAAGYVVGPARGDERVTLDAVYLFGDGPAPDPMPDFRDFPDVDGQPDYNGYHRAKAAWRATPQVRAALDRIGAVIPGAQMPDELHYEELPHRPGEPAWRAWWD